MQRSNIGGADARCRQLGSTPAAGHRKLRAGRCRYEPKLKTRLRKISARYAEAFELDDCGEPTLRVASTQHADVLFLFPWHPLAFLARLRKRDGDCLFAAFHLTASSAFAAFRFAPLVTVHLAFHLLAGTSRVFPFPFLSHKRSPNRVTVNVRVDPAIREPNGDVYRRRNSGFWFSCTSDSSPNAPCQIRLTGFPQSNSA